MILNIILIIICIILLCLYLHKHNLDQHEYEEYNQKLQQAREELQAIQAESKYQLQLADDADKRYQELVEKYKVTSQNNQEALDKFFQQQKAFRQSELDTDFDLRTQKNEEALKLQYNIQKTHYDELLEVARETYEKNLAIIKNNEESILTEVQYQQNRYESLLAPLRQYEKDQQERLYYTIQVPDEYKDDIDFLLTTVAAKVQHPDIINKLVWAEYVKPYLDATFKRVGIEDKPGIYKLTSLITGKSYIGKSTNIKKRITDHMKSVVGISTIADQTVHHVIAKEGYWNWTIEPIIYCEKDQLNELEKYYIDFFKSQEFGYNKNAGGGG